MSKYTHKEVVEERKCGLKYFDLAVSKIGIDSLLDNAIQISKRFPDTWGKGWSNFEWAIGNAVREAAGDKEYQMTWNADEALTTEQMAFVANSLNINDPYVKCWSRRDKPIAKPKKPKKPNNKPHREDVCAGLKVRVTKKTSGDTIFGKMFFYPGKTIGSISSFESNVELLGGEILEVTGTIKKQAVPIKYNDVDGFVFYMDLAKWTEKVV